MLALFCIIRRDKPAQVRYLFEMIAFLFFKGKIN